jgi:hypothetical protein
MRHNFALAAATALAGCVMDSGSRYDPHVPPQSSKIETIDPYKVDKIPDTAYEIWKRDKERNEKIAGEEDKDTYPPLFKGQKADFGGAVR